MKKILLLLFCVTSFPFYAQHFSVGVSVSPDYCSRSLVDNSDGDPIVPSLISVRNTLEIAKTGFTSGINARYKFSKLFSVETGLQYSNKGYKSTTTNLTFNSSDPNDPTSVYFVYNMYHIDVPVLATFSIGSKDFLFCASAGISANFFLKETQGSHVTYNDGSKKTTYTAGTNVILPANFSALFGVGVEWQINDRMSLKVQPMARIGSSKVIDGPIAMYLSSFGLNTGFYIGL